MSTPLQQPAASPAPPPSGPNGRRMLGGTVLGGGGAIGVLAFVGAPWWAVAVAIVLTITAAFGILIALVLMPSDSEHKRDLWLAAMRYLDRRSQRTEQRKVPAPRKPRNSRPRRGRTE
ncbi:hypothetical protein ACGFYZ_03460 [Streptomyces sp. NPDC048330]|uniref:hypothetical protein n=1 Tax=Streptomyces sp. NPDC048330 TaxID=3365533 RepID=UPI00371D8C27